MKNHILKGASAISAIQTSDIGNNFTNEEVKKIVLIY